MRGSKRRVLEAGGLSASQVITGLAESPPVKRKASPSKKSDYHPKLWRLRSPAQDALHDEDVRKSNWFFLSKFSNLPVKILNEDKEEVRGAKLGETLFFKVEISDESKWFFLFVS